MSFDVEIGREAAGFLVRQSQIPALVVGDTFTDVDRDVSYVKTDQTDSSAEVYEMSGPSHFGGSPGGASNVSRQLVSLGAKVTQWKPPGVCGRRIRFWDGDRLVVRIDRQELPRELRLIPMQRFDDFKLCVIVDHDAGALSVDMVAGLIAECNRRNVACIVDPSTNVDTLPAYQHAYAIKCNLTESNRLFPNGRVPIGVRNLYVTCPDRIEHLIFDEHGVLERMEAFFEDQLPSGLPAFGNTVGCGDVVNAVLGYMLTIGASPKASMAAAMTAARFKMRERGGVATPASWLVEALSTGKARKDWRKEG